MLTSESETVDTLNNFFSDIVKKLNIPKFNSNNSVTENVKVPVFKAILKYKNHPRILQFKIEQEQNISLPRSEHWGSRKRNS